MSWLVDAETALLAAIATATGAATERGDRNSDQVAELPFAYTGAPTARFERITGRQVRSLALLRALVILAPVETLEARHDAMNDAAAAIVAQVESDPTLGGVVYDSLVTELDTSEFPDHQATIVIITCQVEVLL